ncbi:hypothetical protein LTR08_008182 [Meristemomyces frigidus]|nr:hypothetical protein LTR08_008182 [Meristemomyces frigidus]
MSSLTTSSDSIGYYELLGLDSRAVDHTLSVQDIKHAYKRALLQHHPDKAAGAPPKGNSPAVGTTVDEITHAYKTLSDPRLRTEYDRRMLRSRPDQSNKLGGSTQYTGLEIVDLDSLVFDVALDIWSRACRCGDAKGFIVTEAELEKHVQDGELTVGCKGCSLWLKVLFGVEE